MTELDTIGHSGTGPASIVRCHMLWDTPYRKLKVYTASLLVFQSDNMVEELDEVAVHIF